MLSDADFMQRCFVLAELGRYTARPNPVVGSVVVRDGQVLGEGWHRAAGEAHAEINALEQAGAAARGATLYVSLEPCCHQGRTGPCTQAVIEAGVAAVVYGMTDPNPAVSGKGLKKLADAGIRLRGPVLEQRALALNPGFIKRMRTGLPFVRCKLGMSLDGHTAMASGESKWITGSQAREDVQRLRARSAAIITGVGTIVLDDPALDVRLAGYGGPQPMKVVADSALQTPAGARIFAGEGGVLLVGAGKPRPDNVPGKAPDGKKPGVRQLPGHDGKVDLRAMLAMLAQEFSCNEVLVEAGPQLSGALLAAGLVDELITYIAPSLLGDQARPMAVLPGLERLEQRIDLEFLEVSMLGKDCRIRSLPICHK